MAFGTGATLLEHVNILIACQRASKQHRHGDLKQEGNGAGRMVTRSLDGRNGVRSFDLNHGSEEYLDLRHPGVLRAPRLIRRVVQNVPTQRQPAKKSRWRQERAAPVAADIGAGGTLPERVCSAGESVPVAAYFRLIEKPPSNLFKP